MRSKSIIVLLILLALTPGIAIGSGTPDKPLVFFAEDQRSDAHPHRLRGIEIQVGRFAETASTVLVEAFAGKRTGQTGPLELSLSDGDRELMAVLDGAGLIRSRAFAGAQAVSGGRFWGSSDRFDVHFSEPVRSLGFVVTDLGDKGGDLNLELTLVDGQVLKLAVPHSRHLPDDPRAAGLDGQIIFYGVTALPAPAVSVAFVPLESGRDFYALDRLMVEPLPPMQIAPPLSVLAQPGGDQ